MDHLRQRVGVKGCLPPSNFETPHFIPLKIVKNSLDYPPETFEPHFLPPSKKKKNHLIIPEKKTFFFLEGFPNYLILVRKRRL